MRTSEKLLRKIWAMLLLELRAELAAKRHAETTNPPADLNTEHYESFSREAPWNDAGKELIESEDAFNQWVQRFRPGSSSGDIEDNIVPYSAVVGMGVPTSAGFKIMAPQSYPVIVVYTRVRRMGLTACEFYWDFVTPADFTAHPETPNPSSQDQPPEKDSQDA